MDIEEAKQRVNLVEYIRANSGGELKKAGKIYWLNPCPLCSRSDHFTVYPESDSFHSFSCSRVGGTIVDYLEKVEGLSLPEAIEKTKQLAGGPLRTERKQEINPAEAQKKTLSLTERALEGNTCQYYYNRGLTDKTIKAYKLSYLPQGYDQYGKSFKYLLPVSDTFSILRSEDDTDKYRNIGSPELFNKRYLDNPSLTGEVFITEGIFDALSLEELDRPAVALNSTANKRKLLSLLENNKEQLKDKLLIIALDQDTEGTQTAKEILDGARGLGLQAVIFNLEGYKDINEALIAKDLPRQLQDFEAGLQDELEAQKLQGTVYEYLQDDYEVDQAKRVGAKDIKTGFGKLDNEFGGGLYPGFYVLGAVTSIGKTALALQLADRIAEQGQQVLFFSLEMARYEMVSRSLTRVLFEQTENKDITTGHVLKSLYEGKDIFSRTDFKAAVEKYKQGPAKYLSLVAGDFDVTVDDIKTRAKGHAARTGSKPVIFVDYLQVVQQEAGSRLTDKQHIDKTVVALKRLSTDLDLPVIVISSFNRASYGKDSEDTNRVLRFMTAFKESGGIEYTADVQIAMDIRKRSGESLEDAMAKEERQVDLLILKNRRGRPFAEVPLTYWPKQNYFREGTF